MSSDPFREYREFKQYDDLLMEDHPEDDVLVEQDNEFIADRWLDAEDYEWM